MPTSNSENSPIPNKNSDFDIDAIVALEWQNWPLRQEGFRLKALLVAMFVGIVWLILLISLPTLTGFALGTALLIALLPYYLPTRYLVDAKGITIKRGSFARRMRYWQEFVRYEPRPNGYLLSPFAQTSSENHLEPFRSLYLPFPHDPAARSLLATILKNQFAT